jgi:F5/8 type C domain
MISKAWWQVDMGRVASIDSMQLWNRTDAATGRLTDYWVFVSNTPFQATDGPGNLVGKAGVWSSHQTSVSPNPMIALQSHNVTGRYVRVQLNGTNYLQLAEVKVFGCK